MEKEMITKRCSQCGIVKEINSFDRRQMSTDGYSAYCKKCKKEKYRRPMTEEEKIQDRERCNKYWIKKRQDNPEEWREKKLLAYYNNKHHSFRRYSYNPIKVKCQKAVNYAISKGRLQKPNNCSKCGKMTTSRRIHAHHEDYSKPFEIVWLCSLCHKDKHRKISLMECNQG